MKLINNPRKIVILVIAGILLTTLLSPLSTHALSQQDIDAINNGWDLWVPDTVTGTNGSVTCISDANLSPGDGTPTPLSFPSLDPNAMATAINAYINLYSGGSAARTSFLGLGSTIVADGQHSNINPFLIVAIAEKESGLGDPTTYNVLHASNSFGRETLGPPDYPGAGINANTLWYKWTAVGSESGVQVSVDYTAAQNVANATNGGDEAS